jgi:hypothetical protein
LPGRAGPALTFLRTTFFALRMPALGRVDAQLGERLRIAGVLVEPEAEGVLGHAGDKSRRFARAQTLLGLPGELRILELDDST